MATSTDNLLSSRDRILLSAKTLFARNSYENTSTVAIARQAGTSESQLMKHFGSKQGLLLAILEQGWSAILHRAYALSSATVRSPQTLVEVLDSVMVVLEQDSEMKSVLVLESRRARRDNPGSSTGDGYVRFITLLENILKDLKQHGILREDLSIAATTAALFGIIEGILFEQVVTARTGKGPIYELDSRKVVEAFIAGLVVPGMAPAESNQQANWGHAD